MDDHKTIYWQKTPTYETFALMGDVCLTVNRDKASGDWHFNCSLGHAQDGYKTQDSAKLAAERWYADFVEKDAAKYD